MNKIEYFTGTIMRCTKYERNPLFTCESPVDVTMFGTIDCDNEIFQENAVLAKTKHGHYIAIDGLSNLEIMFLCNFDKPSIKHGDQYMFQATNGGYVGELFVQQDSLQPCQCPPNAKGYMLLK